MPLPPDLHRELHLSLSPGVWVLGVLAAFACGDPNKPGEPTEPPGPVGIVAAIDDATPGTVRVSWEPVEGATGYAVYWSTPLPVDPLQGTRVADAPNPFIHSGLSAGTTYYYVVTAILSEGESLPSVQVSATPGGSISIQVETPDPRQFVDAQFDVSVTVNSVAQLSSLTAQVGDITLPLTFVVGDGDWEGRLDLAGVPSPSYQTILFTATDVEGTSAQTTVLVRLDRLPVVTMTAPGEDALAAPSIRTIATCADDAGVGCESLTISVMFGLAGQVEKIVAQSSVDQVISLSEFDGNIVRLRADGMDTTGQVTTVIRTVYVDASPHLTPVANGGTGTLLDASAESLLLLDGGSFDFNATDTLRLVNRSSGQSALLYSAPGHRARTAALIPNGAIFVVDPGSAATESLYEWRNGASSVLDSDVYGSSLRVELPFAIWTSAVFGGGGPVTRRDLTTGTNVVVTSGASFPNDVAATGEVAYWVTSPYEIDLYRDGTTTRLTNDGDGDFANSNPVTDGVHVVYRRAPLGFVQGSASIRLSNPSGEITLASGPVPFDPKAGIDYQVNGGWIAFTRPDGVGSEQIWRRSSAGVETQVSAFGQSSKIESVGTSGEIVFTSLATGRRYRAPVGGSPGDIGSALGRPIYIDGQLHVLMGSTLLRVD